MAGLDLSSDHLPSPKPTNSSSTDNIPSSSSSADRKSRPTHKQMQSLRERLVPLPKKSALITSTVSAQATNKTKPSPPSVAPFFQRIKAAFQDKPTTTTTTTTKPTHKTAAPPTKPARSPSPDAEDLIQQLKHHYLQTATTLHEQATIFLSQTHADLARRLTHTLAAPDAAFLAHAEGQLKTLAQPLDGFRIRAQQRGADGMVRCEEKSVGELLRCAEEQVREFEREVGGLWEEWAAAEGEVKGLLRGIGGGSMGEGEGAEMLRRFGEVVEREIGEAEEEVGELGEEAVGVMKEIEKVSFVLGGGETWDWGC